MKHKLELIAEWIISIPLCCLLWPWVTYMTHRDMMDGRLNRCSKGRKKTTYSEFKKYFNQASWTGDTFWVGALFGRPLDDNYLHALIRIIDGRGFLLTPYGLLRSQILMKRTWRKVVKPRAFKWADE